MPEFSTDAAAVMAIYAALTYDIIAAACSSPQTTELNAAARSPTLMKWVSLGLAQAALFAAIGIYIEIRTGRPWWPPALGAGLGATLMGASYIHARNAGINNGGAATENYR
jgi:hypothetical protein